MNTKLKWRQKEKYKKKKKKNLHHIQDTVPHEKSHWKNETKEKEGKTKDNTSLFLSLTYSVFLEAETMKQTHLGAK